MTRSMSITLALGLVGCTDSGETPDESDDSGSSVVVVPLEDLEWVYVHDANLVGWQVWDRVAMDSRWDSGSLLSLGFNPSLRGEERTEDWNRQGTLAPSRKDVPADVLWGDLGLFRIGQGETYRRIGSCDPEFETTWVDGTTQGLTADFTMDATYLGETEWKYGQIEPTWEIELNLYDVEYVDERGDPRIAPHVGPIVGLSGTKCDPPGDLGCDGGG